MIRKYPVLLLLAFTLALYYFNTASLIVCISTIQEDLALPSTSIHWVINIFNLTLVAVILLSGMLVDYLGTRKIYFSAAFFYFVGTLLSAIAMNEPVLLVGRVLQGAGIALWLPVIGALTSANFPVRERGKLVGAYQSIASLFLPIGTFSGGLITTYISWRGIFYAQLVWTAMVSIYALIVSPKGEPKRERAFNYPSALLFSIGIVMFITGIMQGNSWGWTSSALLSLLLPGIAILVIFFLLNKRAIRPFINFRLYSHPLAMAALTVVFAISGARMAVYLWSIFIQVAFGYSSAQIGLLFLFFTFPPVLLSPFAGRLFDRFGAWKVCGVGLLFALLANVFIAFTALTENAYLLMAALLSFGISLPFCYPPSSSLLLNNTDPEHKGKIFSFYQFVSQLGITVIFASLAAVLVSVKDVAKAAGSTNSETYGFQAANLANIGFILLSIVALFYFTSKIKEVT